MNAYSSKDDTVQNLKSSAQAIRSEARDVADDAKRSVREAANDAGRKVKGFMSSAYDEVTHAKDSVTSEIRNNPVQASMIALGAGFLIGLLARR